MMLRVDQVMREEQRRKVGKKNHRKNPPRYKKLSDVPTFTWELPEDKPNKKRKKKKERDATESEAEDEKDKDEGRVSDDDMSTATTAVVDSDAADELDKEGEGVKRSKSE
jgi:hypothetical protein